MLSMVLVHQCIFPHLIFTQGKLNELMEIHPIQFMIAKHSNKLGTLSICFSQGLISVPFINTMDIGHFTKTSAQAKTLKTNTNMRAFSLLCIIIKIFNSLASSFRI